MSTTRTRHESQTTEDAPRRHRVTIGGTTLELTRSEAHEARARLTAAVLGGSDLDDRQDLYAASERQGYSRACAEALSIVDEHRGRLPDKGKAVLDPVRDWLRRQIEVRL